MPRRSNTPSETLSDNVASSLLKLHELLDGPFLDDADPLALELVRDAIGHMQACQEIVRNQSSPERSQVIITDDSEFFQGIDGMSFLIPSSNHASPTAERRDLAIVETANEVPLPTDNLPYDLLNGDVIDLEPNAPDVQPDFDQPESSEKSVARALQDFDASGRESSEDFIAEALLDPEPSDVLPSHKRIDSSVNEMSMADFDASKPSIFEVIRKADPSLGPDDPHQGDDDADANLSRVVSALKIDKTSGEGDTSDGDNKDSSDHSCAEEPTYESIVASFRTLYPGLTPIGEISLLLRCVAKRFGRRFPLRTFLQGLTLLTPSTPPLVERFVGPRSRKGRQVEIAIPDNLRLDTFVYCENLGDFYEQVVYSLVLKPASKDGSDSLTEEDVRKAFEGPLDGIKLGLLDDKAITTLESVLQSMEHILNAAREADIEHHYRRTHCEIISACLRCLGISHFARSGSSSASKDHEGEANSSVNANPDVEDVFGSKGEMVTSATEMKTARSLKNAFITILLRLMLDESNVTAFKDQLNNCPGFAQRFIWPEDGVYMRAAEQMIVQVFTAMVYKKLRVYELSSSDRSVFFFRDSLESTTLYVSRVYNTPDLHATSDDPNTPDCMTNLTRFAMRYIAANDLYDKVAALLPPARKEHWDTVTIAKHGYAPPYGIDTRTGWKRTGKAFYSPAPAEQQPIVQEQPAPRKKLRKPNGPTQ
ncbi:hypothetical protein EV715DRAFT_276488 [Schizophyllum commune]